MNISIEKELRSHIGELVDDGVLNEDNKDDWHHLAFNEDYYIIGYFNAEQWLKKHDVSAWEAIETIIKWEKDVFGEVTLKIEDINSERIVNLYIYVVSEQVVYDIQEGMF